MKQMYWRPRRVSRTALLLITIASVAGYFALEQFPVRKQEANYQEKIAAAQLTETAFKTIREEKKRRGIVIDPEADPAQSGLIGALVTPVTTSAGALPSKQTTANPNFSAVIVGYLKDLRLREGDVVAVGYSGSFPALNVAVLCAVETLKLKPVIIASASSSGWGANQPGMVWLDWEKHLYKRKIISHRTLAASIGGIEDIGIGLTKRGRRLLRETIERHEVDLIEPTDFQDSVDQRLRLYRQHAGADPIRAYINVGGGAVSVGRKYGKKLFKAGLNRKPPFSSFPVDSVIGRFLDEGVPAVHLIRIKDLAELYGFPVAPIATPTVGEGAIFFREKTNKALAIALLAGILFVLYVFVRSDIGFRITQTSRNKQDKGAPEPMV